MAYPSNNYRAEAIRQWEETYKDKSHLSEDAATLRTLLKEAQITQLALLIENEQLKKQGSSYSPNDTAALRVLLASLPQAIFIKDIQDDYRILFWNNYTSEFMGKKVEEAIGRTDHELFPATTATVIRRLDRQAAEESLKYVGSAYTSTATFYGIQRSVIKDAAGEPLFLVGSITNIPALPSVIDVVKLDDNKELVRDQLKDIERISHFGHWELDWSTKTEYWSDELYHILGYEKRQITPSRSALQARVHPEDAQQLQDAYIRLWEQQKGFRQCYRIKTAHHLIQYVEEDCKVEFDEQRKLLRVVGVLRNVTEQQEQAKQLHVANQAVYDLEYALNQTTLVLVLNSREEIVSVNRKFCKISGFQEQEVIGKSYGSLSHKQLDKELWKEIQTEIHQGNVWQGELQEYTKAQAVYWTQTSIVPFLDDNGTPIQYIVTQIDITNRKHLEKKLREAKKEADKNAKIKEDFLANMSHEIRTPMNGVLGFSRLLLQTKMNDLQHEYAQSIYSSAENLLVIVNDILDVSKIESGTFQLKETPFNLKKRIEEGLSILKVSVQKKNLTFNIHVDPNIPEMILGVPDRLSQVLINLVGNAIKFTKKGTIVLEVSLESGYLLFKVIDTGIGIPEDKLDTIFESFTQAENYTTREYGGTGLGLSISKKLVNVMGGQIGVTSKLGQGSTFFFSLPFKPLEQTTEPYTTIQNQIAVPKADVPLVLVVEDNKVNQELVLIYLNLLACECHVAENGIEALASVQRHQYDLILMDVQMPKMDGMAATSAIRKINSKVPIVAMSAHALEREKKRCFEIGMNDYIAKPFKVEALQEIMAKYIKLPSQKEQSGVPRIQHLAHNAVEKKEEPILLSNYTNIKISKELLLLFKEELLKLVDNMQEAFRAKDVRRIQRQMHRIKPNFELFDLANFYQWSDTIDNLALNNASIEAIQVVYDKFEQALPSLIQRINREVE
jgi:PAS domain S-box-containing protein